MEVRSFTNKLKSIKLVGLDAMIFIYHFDQRKPYYPLTLKFFELLEKRKLKAITSIMSPIEVLSHPPLEKEPKKLEAFREFFAKEVGLEICDVNSEIGESAAALRRKHRLRTPDAIQLSTAMESQAEIFITNDDRFRKITHFPILLLKDFV